MTKDNEESTNHSDNTSFDSRQEQALEEYHSVLSEEAERHLIRFIDNGGPFAIERPFRGRRRVIDSDEKVGDVPVHSGGPQFDPTKMAMELRTALGKIGVVGYSFAIAELGDIVKAGGAGWARAPWEGPSAGRPMTAKTRITLASISKPITAVAMMQLRDNTDIEPELKLEESFYPYIEESFPEAHDSVKSITIRQLLSHTSGFNWGCDMPAHPDAACYRCGKLAELFKAKVLTPGDFRYDNTNYCVLREVIKHVSGESYTSYVQDNVFSPMGITDMSCAPDADKPTLYYSLDYPAGSHPTYMYGTAFGDYTNTCSAYGWYGSALDLAEFLVHVRSHTVLSKDSTNEMFYDNLGWWKGNSSRGTYYSHRGAWHKGPPAHRGFIGVVTAFPDDIDAVLLINTMRKDTSVNPPKYEPDPGPLLVDAYESAFGSSIVIP